MSWVLLFYSTPRSTLPSLFNRDNTHVTLFLFRFSFRFCSLIIIIFLFFGVDNTEWSTFLSFSLSLTGSETYNMRKENEEGGGNGLLGAFPLSVKLLLLLILFVYMWFILSLFPVGHDKHKDACVSVILLYYSPYLLYKVVGWTLKNKKSNL
eukprot:gene13464-9272_t